jgi:predicted short-subunit dehydrogenase-like oxidoreductase (DUF2520 family)
LIAIIGGGRMGRGLALALADAGERVELWSRRESAGGVEGAVSGASLIVIAVADDAIAEVAAQLARAAAISADQVVLHLSGLLGREALRALERTGAALGSFHPMQSIADPARARASWRGAAVGLEGDSRAIAAGERLAALLELAPVHLPAGSKPLYHAGAVIASNYLVALMGWAQRLGESAGLSPEAVLALYRPIVRGTAANLASSTPAEALTGPIARGDVATIATHLAALSDADRGLYALLGLEAVRLARAAGLGEEQATAVERVLRVSLPRPE